MFRVTQSNLKNLSKAFLLKQVNKLLPETKKK